MREEEIRGVLRRKTLVEVLVILFEKLQGVGLFDLPPSKSNGVG
jgi:hypothetical protein